MRLLNTITLRLEEFHSPIPPYAILSHCWETDEVTFEDISYTLDQDASITRKAGWQKIRGSCRQALQQDYRYLWVDTCCINKSSSAELSEAINSMFQWYHEAQVCLVYLSDVTALRGSPEYEEDNLMASRWWTRGWTLQELISPTSVEFYDVSWEWLTSRTIIANKIQSCVGIDAAVLLGNRQLHTYSVAQRFSWAALRQTTRVEDRAYSLLGIFDVNMPLLYGEGPKAFHRLQEEVMRLTQDLSILAWPGLLNKDSSPPLATSLSSFAECKNILPYLDPFEHYFNNAETVVSPRSLQLTVKLVNLNTLDCQPDTGLVAILNCRHAEDITTLLGLKVKLLSPLSWPDFVKSSENVQCIVDVSNRLSTDRIAFVDIIDVQKYGVTKTILMQREPQILPSFDIKLQFSHIWLRFDDAHQNRSWVIEDIFPSQYWTFSTKTFDLTAARTDKIYRTANKLAGSKSQESDYPVYGAIIVTDFQDSVFIQFREYSRIWKNDRILFKLSRHPTDKISHVDCQWDFFNESDEQAQSIKLNDGSLFQVELRTQHMTDQKIALLAVTIENRAPGPTNSLRRQVSALIRDRKKHVWDAKNDLLTPDSASMSDAASLEREQRSRSYGPG